MLISSDLLKIWSKCVTPPAQLCLIRVLGTDEQFVVRVRYKDVHLDYPLTLPMFDTSDEVQQKVNFDELTHALVTMSKMVVPPGVQVDHNWCSYPVPTILAPIAPGKFYYEW